MGQYYKPISIDKQESVYTWDYDNGMKLMEHSYIGNSLMNAVELLLSTTWKNTQIVWAGDYADKEPDGDNLFFKIETTVKPDLKDFPKKGFRYIINTSRLEYIDKHKIKKDHHEYRIHPLSLLTCEGNGRGGGDFRNDSDLRVGTWARDRITVSDSIPKGFTEINGQFKE
jgi:hypothetical protein